MYRPDFILVSRITEQAFEDIVYKWLIEGDYTPDDIIENIITKKNLYYLPIYYYRILYSAKSVVEIGHTRYEERQVWDNDKKTYVTRGNTVVDWLPYSQLTSGKLQLLDIARDLPKGEILEAVSKQINQIGFSGQGLIPFDEFYLQNKEIVDFEYKIEEIWENRTEKLANKLMYEKAYKDLPGSLKRGHKLIEKVVRFEREPISFYMPYWVFQYKYRNKDYYVFHDANAGQTIGGTKPTDKTRRRRVITINLFYWLMWPFASWGIAYGIAWLYSQNKGYDSIDVPWYSHVAFLVSMIGMFIIKRKKIKRIKSLSKTARELLLTKRYNNNGHNNKLGLPFG